MGPDLSSSIARHPHPFHLELSAPSRSASRTRVDKEPPVPSADHGDRHYATNKNNTSSTGVQVKAGEVDATTGRYPMRLSASSGFTDIESQTLGGTGVHQMPWHSSEIDPYGLQASYKTDSQIERIKSTGTRKRATNGGSTTAGGNFIARDAINGGNANDRKRIRTGDLFSRCLFPPLSFPVPSSARRALQAQKLKGFYKTQNEAIERMLKSVEQHRAEARQEAGEDQLRVRIAVYVYGAVSSGSLSLFTTMADSIFDPLSNITLILTNRAVKRVDAARFPSGKARLETVGNVVFCFLMTSVSCILIAFAVRDLAGGRPVGEEVNRFHLPSVVAGVIAFTTKLVLFLYTWAIKDKYSQAYILWQDHRNDLLINGFGILTSVGGSKLVWWIDPMGAIILSVIVSAIWLRTAFTEFLLLVGVVALVEAQQLITYVCVTHSPAVRQIDTVRVYHSGPRLIAEVDIVIERNATLAETHDVAEALQSKLERLPDIERAYVHVDYETTHKPEHFLKKEL